MFDLTSRTALVTGASRGIGRAIALALAEAGCDIIIHYANRREDAELVATQARKMGREAAIIQSDLSKPGAGRHLAEEVCRGARDVDILVLNAATQIYQRPDQVDDASFAGQMNSGFRSGWELATVLVARMAERGWGRLITIGSVQQQRPNLDLTVYGAMKCAQAHLARNFGRAYAGSGVTADNVAPGLIDTDRCNDLKADNDGWNRLIGRIPVGRAGVPEDLAGITVTLASPAGAYITGADIPVDGGLAIP